MSSLMLINPRKRSRSPAQKAATRRMLAARHRNPRRRVRHHAVHHVAKRRHNPIRATHHRRIRRHRNPISLGAGGMGGLLMNGLKGAGGAVVVNVVASYLPASMNTGNMLYLVRAALAIALGTVGRKAMGNSARVMAEGALAVNFHDFINTIAVGILPGAGLRGVGMYMQGVDINTRRLPGATGASMPFDSELSATGEYIYH
jgi:hypothetical protein